MISPSDTVESAADKMLAASAAETLQSLRRSLPIDSVQDAAVAILKARWVHIYGFGASATVAADAQRQALPPGGDDGRARGPACAGDGGIDAWPRGHRGSRSQAPARRAS